MTFKKIVSILLITVLTLTLFTACNGNGRTVLDFDNYSEKDLGRLVGKEVTLYGYFTLNSAVEGLAYVAPVPYTAIMSDKLLEGTDSKYYTITLQDSKIMPIYCSVEPEYTSSIIKVVGTLKKVNTYDEVSHLAYTYAITDATTSVVESYSLGPGLKEFMSLCKAGYTDVIYNGVLNLEMFGYDYYEGFPKEEHYDSIKSDFKDVKMTGMYIEYMDLLERLHTLYEYYGKEFNEKGKIDKDDMLLETEKLMKDFITMVDKYAEFTITKDNGDGFDRLNAKNAVIVDDTEQETEPSETQKSDE